jgi:TolA-binding protein
MSRLKRLVGWVISILIVFQASPARADSSKRGADSLLRSYQAANGFLHRGLYDLAADEYRSFLRDQADHEKAPVARYGLAVCLFRTGKYADAAGHLEQLAPDRTFEFAADALTLLGQCKLAAGEFDSAAIALRRVVDEHGDHKLAAEAGAQLAEALYQAGKHEEAVGGCRAVAQRWPDAPQIERVLLIAARAELARANDAAAAPYLEKLISTYPQSANRLQAALLLAHCLHRLNRGAEAVRHYREVLKSADTPLRPDALYGLAVLLLQTGDAAESGKLLDELIDKFRTGPLLATAYLQRGRAWFEAGSFDDAAESFDRAAQAAPDLADESAYWMAKCDLRRSRFNEAARRLGKALTVHPQSRLAAEMTYDKAVALIRAGEADAAIKELQGFISRFNKHALLPDAMELLALHLHLAARYPESQAQCDEFIMRFAAHPRAAAIGFMAAENDFLQDHHAEAARRYRRFLDSFPKDAQGDMARYRLAMSLQFSGKHEEATPLLAEAAARIATDERVRPALYVLAIGAFDRGEWKRAEELFARYLEKPVDLATGDDARLRLGLAQIRQNRADDALRTFERLVSGSEKGAHRFQAMFERGQALLVLKRTGEAREALEQVVAEGADSRFAPYARNHLGALALQSGDFKRAADLFAAAAQNAPTPELSAEALFNRGEALSAGQDFRAAAQAFQEFLKTFPNHQRTVAAEVHHAVALSRQKRFKEALQTFDRVPMAKLDPPLRAAAIYERAGCLRESGRNEDASEALRQLATNRDAGPLRLHAALELATQEMAAKRFDSALQLLAGLKRDLESADDEQAPAISEQVVYRIGICQFELGRYAEAAQTLSAFTKSFEKSESLTAASYYAAESCFQDKKYERAIELFDRALSGESDEPHIPAALLRCGEAHAQLQRWPKSEDTFNKYLRQFRERDGWCLALFGVGWARENQGRHDEAIKAYREVVEKHKGPTAARAQFQIGECLFAKRQYDEAVRELLKVDILYDYPEWSAAALYEAGRCFEKLARSAEARQHFKSVAEKYGNTEWARLAAQRLAELAASTVPGHSAG